MNALFGGLLTARISEKKFKELFEMRQVARTLFASLVSCTVLCACANVPERQSQGHDGKIDEVMTRLRGHLFEKCGMDYGTLATSQVGSYSYSMAEDGIYMKCNCIPGKLPQLQSELKDAAVKSDEELKRLFDEGFRTINVGCAAERFRMKVDTSCQSGALFGKEEVHDKEKVCGCMVDTLADMSDEVIVEGSIQAYQNFKNGANEAGNTKSNNVVEETLLSCMRSDE